MIIYFFHSTNQSKKQMNKQKNEIYEINGMILICEWLRFFDGCWGGYGASALLQRLNSFQKR